MTTIAICNLKGGTGKTTTAIFLAYALTRTGDTVTVVDADPRVPPLNGQHEQKIKAHPSPSLWNLVTPAASPAVQPRPNGRSLIALLEPHRSSTQQSP